jgi:hypothetical protein
MIEEELTGRARRTLQLMRDGNCKRWSGDPPGWYRPGWEPYVGIGTLCQLRYAGFIERCTNMSDLVADAYRLTADPADLGDLWLE